MALTDEELYDAFNLENTEMSSSQQSKSEDNHTNPPSHVVKCNYQINQ